MNLEEANKKLKENTRNKKEVQKLSLNAESAIKKFFLSN